MRRLLWIALGLGLAAVALLALVRGGPLGGGSALGTSERDAPPLDAPPLDEIDAESRRQLERALIEAERREAAPR